MHGYTTFISGGAQGVDQLAFWAVNRLKTKGYPVTNIVYIPFKGQNSRWSEKGTFSKHEYGLMVCKYADRVRIITNSVNDAHFNEVKEAMLKRNRAMVDDSDAVFGVYWDNTWQTSNAKDPMTAYTLRYGKNKNKPYYVFHPTELRFV